MSKKKYTEEGHEIISEGMVGNTMVREVRYPKVVLPELDEDEKFAEKLDEVFSFGKEINEDIFQLENFSPEKKGKDVEGGTWIKVNTEIGYNVYFAKKSKKILDVSALERKLRVLDAKNLATPEDELKNIDKRLAILEQLSLAEDIENFGEDLKYVKIQTTRTQVKYLLPYEYEIVGDIQGYVDAYSDKNVKKSIRFRANYTAEQKDAIFYLQSRGISKKAATMMVKVQNGYFICDVQAMLIEAYQS